MFLCCGRIRRTRKETPGNFCHSVTHWQAFWVQLHAGWCDRSHSAQHQATHTNQPRHFVQRPCKPGHSDLPLLKQFNHFEGVTSFPQALLTEKWKGKSVGHCGHRHARKRSESKAPCGSSLVDSLHFHLACDLRGDQETRHLKVNALSSGGGAECWGQ